jgi:hypothetical protein
MSEFDSSIEMIDDDAFEAAFSGKTPKAEDLKTGGPKDEKEEKKEPIVPATKDDEIEIVEDEDEENDDSEEEEEAKKKKPVKAEHKEEEEVDENAQATLKAHVDHLINTGAWKDLEDKDNIVWTDELFAEVAEQQVQEKALDYFNELVDRSGMYGKSILQHIANGGDPDKILDLFKEQKSFEALNTEDVDGQKTAIEKYYGDVLGWKKERVKKHIERLELDEELKEEADHVKGEFEKHTKKELDKIQEEQVKQRQKEEQEALEFEASLKSAVAKRTDLDDTARKKLINQVLVYDEKLPDGRPVTKFWKNFTAIQNDPAAYLKLVEFCENPNKYDEAKEENGGKKKEVARIKFLNANATANKKSNNQMKVSRNSSSGGGLNW